MLKSLLVVFIMGTSSAYAETVSVEDGVPTFTISGPIVQGNIIPTGDLMVAAAESGEKKAQLIINSPGGEVITGLRFLSRMEAAQKRGMKVVCFVGEVAASMAFQILIHCDERHSLNTSFLLWHRARVYLGGGMFSQGVAMTSVSAAQLAKDLGLLDEFILSELKSTLGAHISDEELKYHFEQETLHIGVNLHKMAPKFITSHSSIPGLMKHLTKSVRKSTEGESEDSIYVDMSVFKYGSQIYISDTFIK